MCIDGLFLPPGLSLRLTTQSQVWIRHQQLWGRLILQRMLENFIDPANRQNMQVRFNIVRNIRKVTLIICRNQNSLDVAPMCGEQFSLSPLFSGPALESNFARHRDV